MHSQFQKLLIPFSVLILVLACLPDAADARESGVLRTSVEVDGQSVNTEYIMRDGHFMVPAIFLKHTGTKVDWNEQYQSVVFRTDTLTVANRAGTNLTDVKTGGRTGWIREVWPVSSANIDGKTYVPLVQLGQRLGLDITYNEQAGKTTVNNPLPRQVRRIGRGSPSQKQIALTFDDGPDSIYTEQILDILNEKGVPATFFAVGQQINKYPALMKRIVNEGHGIGNHSLTHPNFSRILSEEVKKEVIQTQQILASAVNRQPDLFRPPYGSLTRADEEWLHRNGFRIIMWSVDTLDWTGISAEEIMSNVRSSVSPGGIILQHNIDVNPGMLDGSVEALPRIIDELQAEGYTFVTVQTLLDS